MTDDRFRNEFLEPTQVTQPGESTASRAAQAVRALQDLSRRSSATFDQEEALSALAILRTADQVEYQRWLPQVAFLLSESSGQLVPVDQVAAAVDVLAGQPPGVAGGSGQISVGNPPALPDEESSLPGLIGGIPEAPEGTVSGLRPGGPAVSGQVSGGFEEPYRHGDQFTKFASKSPMEIQRLQRELEQAGLLEKGKYRPGFWDVETAQAMQTAMGYGNQSGTNWQSVVKQLRALPKPVDEDGSGRPRWTPPPKLLPDMASLRQTVKGRFRQALGREPTAEELRRFAASLHSDFAAVADQAIAAERRAFFEANPEAAPQFNLGPTTTRPVIPESITQIDPAARFAEVFDKRFGPEIRRNERVANVAEQRQSVMQSLLTMQGLVGQ